MAKKIRITAKRDGFRRAGIAHHGTQTYPADHFSEEELAALKAEPMLVVDEIDEPEQPKGNGSGNGAGSASGKSGSGNASGAGKGDNASGKAGKE